MSHTIPFLFVLAMIAATVIIGIAATRRARSASDFFVAGRSVGIFSNASAISGEYLSAASFLGIAGLVMKNGYDALWYPVGYAAGYLLLLLFIAGPLRRFGAYTIPDFAEGRFDSPGFRKVAVIFVLCIGLFYTMPQMKGAGITMGQILGWPYWVGIAVVGTVITFNVALGGMKGITLVQAFQYWAKAFAISVPAFIIMSVYGSYPQQISTFAATGTEAPQLKGSVTVTYPGTDKTPANAASLNPSMPTYLTFPKGASVAKVSLSRKSEPNEDPIRPGEILQQDWDQGADSQGKSLAGLPAQPKIDHLPELIDSGKPFALPAGTSLHASPAAVKAGGQPVLIGGKPVYTSVKIEFAEPSEVVFTPPYMFLGHSPGMAAQLVPSGGTYAGSPAPNAQINAKWLNPFGTLTGKYGYPLLYTYSLIIALICGTAGLPHILVRFYTNPDGRAAKRTTFWVMILLGLFYAFTPVWGTLGRALDPALYANSKTDAVLIALPTLLPDKLLGEILAGVTSAGAFAAFMSTFSGLLVSMSGAFAHDIYGKILRPNAPPSDRLIAFKWAAVVVGLLSMGLGLLVEQFDIALLVGWAFAIAAASYFPLLLLGSWWRGLTRQGATAGMLIGGTLSFLAIVVFMAVDKKALALDIPPLGKALMEQPAIWGVPLSLGIMVVVSLMTRRSVPSDIDFKMLRLHAPEEMGLSRNYIEQ